MAEEDIPPLVRSFLFEHIDSVLQLEVLLLLHAQRPRRFSAREVSSELRIDADWVTAQLAYLCARGILACDSPSQPAASYQFAPRSPAIDEAVRLVAQAYAQRRVSVISSIFNRPVQRLRSFAEAFRIRKDKTDG